MQSIRKRALVQKFFADRGTHLAAMIAYFALLSFVPLTFLALAALGLAHRADESSFLVRELQHAFPGTEIGRIVDLVRAVQKNAATLGIVGAVALLWTSLSLFSVLESVVLEASFQILPVYERYADVNPALRAFGGPAILLVWLYVMANFVVFGAEVNWWLQRRRRSEAPA